MGEIVSFQGTEKNSKQRILWPETSKSKLIWMTWRSLQPTWSLLWIKVLFKSEVDPIDSTVINSTVIDSTVLTGGVLLWGLTLGMMNQDSPVKTYLHRLMERPAFQRADEDL